MGWRKGGRREGRRGRREGVRKSGIVEGDTWFGKGDRERKEGRMERCKERKRETEGGEEREGELKISYIKRETITILPNLFKQIQYFITKVIMC